MRFAKKLTGIVAAICLAVQMLAGCVSAAGQPVYLALGDSISTGYGLPEGSLGFVDRIAARYDTLAPINCSVNGNTAEGIYAQLLTGELDDELAAAELVTVTCGGNDLMAVLYVKLANGYNTAHPDAPIRSTDVTDIFGGTHPTLKTEDLMDYALAALKGLAVSAEFEAGLADYAETLGRVLDYIRCRSPHAHVVVPTQYNPYNTFRMHVLDYQTVYHEIEAGVLRLNEVIRDTAALYRCTVAEVYPAFRDSEENLCNAKANYLSPPEMDFHPNAAGHAVMADVILERLSRMPVEVCTVIPEEGHLELALSLTEDALLAAVFYDENGRVTGVELKPVTWDAREVVLQMDPVEDSVQLRIFLLDKYMTPLYPAIHWHTEGV